MADSETSNPQNDRPEWLDDRFESAEALAKSYKELEGRFTQESQARAALEQQNAALEDNYSTLATRFDEFAASQPQQQTNPNDQMAYLAEQLGVEPEYINAAALLAQNAAQAAFQQSQQQLLPQQEAQLNAQRDIAIRLAGDQMRATYPDWDEKVDKVREALEANPGFVSDADILSPDRLAQAFESVYKVVSYDQAISGAGESGQPNVAAIQLAAKLNAQTATGASSRPDPVADEAAAWQAIANAKPPNYYDKR